MERYWAFIDQKLAGPFEVSELMSLPSFDQKMLVCRQGDDAWKPAQEFSSIHHRLMIAIGPSAAPAPAPASTHPTAPTKPAVSATVSGDFLSPDFQFAHPPTFKLPKPFEPKRRSGQRAQPVAKAAPVAKAKPLAKKRRVLVIAVLSLLITTGNLMVYATSHMGIPITGLLTPYQQTPQKIRGTRFTQRTPAQSRKAIKAAAPTSRQLWPGQRPGTVQTTRRSRRPWFSKTKKPASRSSRARR